MNKSLDINDKLIYDWYQFKLDCDKLAYVIRDSKLILINIFGIPRGGVPIAVRLASLLDLPLTNNPIIQTLIVDDVVDTGLTREHYAMFPNYVSLHYKPWATRKPTYYVHETTKWIVYPWEVKDE
jgi:hypoxanthine phosphoribosyltransferase